jgi:hypothetical protein
VGAHTQKIGLCIAINRPVRFLMTVGTGASFESPGPFHACIMFLLESKRQELNNAYGFFQGAIDRL